MENITRLPFAKKLYFFLFLALFANLSLAQVKIGTTNYPNLREAFNGINAGHYTGQNIIIEITGNTTENQKSVITQLTPVYQSITIKPSGVGSRVITFPAGNEGTLEFNGAHNITIDGNNKQLSFSNQTGFRGVQFINTDDVVIKDCWLSGYSDGGMIYVQGNSQNYMITGCTITTTNFLYLPLMGIEVQGDQFGNPSEITVQNNEIHDYGVSPGSPATTACAISFNKTGSFKIKQNKIYQALPHTTKAIYPIYLFDINQATGAQCEVSNNIIGGQADITNTYPITNEKCNSYSAIRYSGNGAYEVKIDANIISDISVTGVDSGSSTNHVFTGIEIVEGSAIITNNTIGSVISTGRIKDNSTNTGTTGIFGIKTVDQGKFTITNNFIGGFEAYAPATSIPVNMYGINVGYAGNGGTNTKIVTCDNNIIGADVPLSFRNDSQNPASTVTGISVTNQQGSVNSNTIQNLSGYGITGGVVGIERNLYLAQSLAKTLLGNTIYNLTNSNATGASEVIGIKQTMSDQNNYDDINRNFIYGLNSMSSNTASQVIGIYNYQLPGKVLNNMIVITGNMNAAQISGIKTDYAGFNFWQGHVENNSVYIGGTQTVGNAPSSAFYLTGTVGVFTKIYNNIFVNNRAVSGSSTAPHYDIYYNPVFTNYRDLKANLFADPNFIAPLGSPPNLHINPALPTLVESHGYTDAAFHTLIDFDNQTRSGLTPVDIGADAGNFIAITPPVITSVSATATCTNSTIQVTGTGLSTVTEAKIGSTVMAISNATETSLTINTGNAALSGTLTLTNPAGSATYPTTINIYTPPAFTQQPVSVTACGSSAVSFTVTATNAITYQWRRNGVNLSNDGTYSNVNTATLNISSAGLVPFGSTFDVVITGTANACSVVSSGATLMADLPPRPIISASGSTTICQGGSVTLSTNYNGPAAQLTGTNNYFDFTRHIGYDFTVEYWVRTTQTGGTGSQWYNGQGIVDARMSSLPQQCEFGTSLVGNKLAFGLGGFNIFGNYSPTTIMSATPINSGQWVHVAVTRKEATGELRIYLNGVLDAVGFTSLHGAIITPNMRVGGLQTGGNFLNGGIDDVRCWSYVRSQAQILSGMSQSYPAGTPALVDNFPLNENSGNVTANLATGTNSFFVNSPGWTNRSTTSNYISYTWSNGAHTPTINVTAPGNYSVMVGDQDGCSASWIPVTVTVQSVSVTPSAPTVCQGSPATLTASGAVSYSWSPPIGLNTTFGPSVIATPATTTTYTVTGTMASGCQSTKQVIVTVNPPVTVSASQLNVMPGGSATLTASGGSGYTWSPAAGLNTTAGASVIATPSATITYTVTSAACGNSATVTITVLPEFSPGNNALDFDGTDDYVSIPAQAGTVSGSFTVEAWVRPTHPTKRMHVISSRNGQDHSFDIQITGGNMIHGDIGDGTNWLTTAADATFNYPVNAWTHIAYVVTPSDYKIYANGNLVGSGVLSGTPLLYSPAHFFTIGKNTTENTFFQGTMDDIRLYNAALPGAQIQSELLGNYQTAGLLAYFNCNEGVAGGNNAGINNLVDQNIPGNFHGTLHNFALSGSASNWVEGQGTQPQQQPQAIDFQPLSDVVYGDADFNLTASATSGLPVSYSSSNPEVASVTGNTVTIHSAGTTEITATQDGDSFYTAAEPVAQTLMVTPKPVTMTDVIVADKIYDRNTDAIIAGSISGLVGSDNVGVAVMASFVSFDVGNNIPVTMEMELIGAQSANYIITPPVITGNILPKTLTMPNAAADNKVYDGTTAATITGSLSGIIAPDMVTIASNTGVFASPGVWGNIPVDAQIILGGVSAGNYVLQQPTGLSAAITTGVLTAAISGTAAICDGQNTPLTVTITGGNAPYTVQYTDGSQVFTINDYDTGNSIEVSPVMTANYTLVSVTDANASADVTGISPVTITVNPNITYYADADGDGYGNHSATTATCIGLPSGYVTNDGDCDDTRPTVHPGAVEIGYNGIDDNCNGIIDEGFPPKTTVIQSAMCDTTLAAIDSQLIANIVAGAQGYRWKITALSGPFAGQVQFLDTALRTMKLTQLVNYTFATQYKVEIAVLFAGFWQPFTVSSCTVTTPSPITQLSACGQTLSAMADVISANIVPFATGYKFRITDPVNTANTQTIERNVREFRMNLITNFIVQYGKQYNVEVSIKNTDGTWLPYGNVCSVTTPAFPTTSLQEVQCNNYVVPNNSTQIYALSYTNAIAYVFQLSGSGLLAPVEVTKSTRSFTLNDFAGQLLPGATYNVKVRLVFNANDPVGPFGKVCTITTPGLSRQTIVKADIFNAIAYPNPFADDFDIDVTSSSNDDIHIKVYDMTGRLLETEVLKAGSDIPPIGSHFPSGVYNVVVTQGNDVKTLRVIKR